MFQYINSKVPRPEFHLYSSVADCCLLVLWPLHVASLPIRNISRTALVWLGAGHGGGILFLDLPSGNDSVRRHGWRRARFRGVANALGIPAVSRHHHGVPAAVSAGCEVGVRLVRRLVGVA